MQAKNNSFLKVKAKFRISLTIQNCGNYCACFIFVYTLKKSVVLPNLFFSIFVIDLKRTHEYGKANTRTRRKRKG